MSGEGGPDLAIALVDRARQLLSAARSGADTQWRWLIRTDYFDALRDRLEAAGVLDAFQPDCEPTFLGIPYDLGWPPIERPILLTLSIEPLARNEAAD